MPIYQYHCAKCNSKFELKQSFNDESIVACPKCQNEAQRLFCPVPVIFKGSGFYTTDNRKTVSEDTREEKSVQVKKAETTVKDDPK